MSSFFTKKRGLLAVILLLLLMCGCDGGGSSDEGPGFDPPPFRDAYFDGEKAETNGNISVDYSHTEEGYVGILVNNDKRIKCIISKDDESYKYDVFDDVPAIFPLQCGNGVYLFRILEHVADNKYAVIYESSRNVTISDEYQPYIRPSNYSDYSEDSLCVKKAGELAEKANSETAFIESIYAYVVKNVSYDREKAATVNAGYLPYPDETFQTGKGICFDYASLAAAMLRSQGIPTKIIVGYVSGDLYHAWNMFYTPQTGWRKVSFKVEDDSWIRMDLTFSANGEDSKFIGDGKNYKDVYRY